MEMIGQFRVEPDFYPDQSSQLTEEIVDPLPSMLEALSGNGVLATEEGTAHYAGPDMVDAKDRSKNVCRTTR